MTNLKIYAIFVLIIAVLLGGFYAYYRMTEAEKAKLIANNAAYKVAVELQNETIKTMKADALKQAAANINLSTSLAAAEADLAKRAAEIDAEDLVKGSLENPAQVEKKINDDYKAFNDAIVRAARRTPGLVLDDSRDGKGGARAASGAKAAARP